MAAALAAMVARLSIGKEGLEPEAYYTELAAEAEALSNTLFDGGREELASLRGHPRGLQNAQGHP